MQEKEQRALVYRFLHSVLCDSNLELIAPLHQLSALNGQKASGYCHGYCRVWEERLGQNLSAQFIVDWTALYTEKNIEYFIPLDQRVKTLQKNQKKNYQQASYCGKESLSYQLTQYFSLDKCKPGLIYTLDFGKMPCMGQFFFKSYPQHIKRWHESRFYIDDESFFHWFDPNFGWLKTTAPKPDIPSFFSKLHQIFALFDYDKHYRFICIEVAKLDCASQLNTNKEADLSNLMKRQSPFTK